MSNVLGTDMLLEQNANTLELTFADSLTQSVLGATSCLVAYVSGGCLGSGIPLTARAARAFETGCSR